jgi:hypothetical protein
MKKKYGILIIIFILFGFGFYLFKRLYSKAYTSEDFHITVIKSDIDYDNDGIDDYTDIVQCALAYGKTRPKYKSAYYEGGYPPSGEGVCTDVIWRSLACAGYNLKELVDEDIKENKDLYTRIDVVDSNIDFRRVYNLHVFFENNTLSLTTDLNQIEQFQPGDIVIFNNDSHIGIISDKRNSRGIPFLIHHTNSFFNRINHLEEDVLSNYKIIGHYRFQLKDE